MKLWAHRTVALTWALSAIPAYLWWQQSILFVIGASVFANVYSAISAIEAADDRAVLRELRELRREVRDQASDDPPDRLIRELRVPDPDEPRTCGRCGAICDLRIRHCECGPTCTYPPIQ